MRSAALGLLALSFTLGACGKEDPGEDPISGAEATELCAHHLAPKLPGVDFSWEEPIVRVPDEFAHIVGTGVKERERFSLHCSVDLINAEVVGSQHGLK